MGVNRISTEYCAFCGGELDTGFECKKCGADFLPHVKLSPTSQPSRGKCETCGGGGFERVDTEDGLVTIHCRKCGAE